MSATLRLLLEGRRRELEQALFYRFLCGEARDAGQWDAVERLDALLADEQHHVARLTARILELGGRPEASAPTREGVPTVAHWEEEARLREAGEVAWYEGALRREEDAATRLVLGEILECERLHRDLLVGQVDTGEAQKGRGGNVKGLLDLTGKNALVTGGSRGVGKATALLLGRAGASVGVGYRRRREEAEAVVAQLRELGVHAWAHGGDLADAGDVEALFERSDREFSGLDIFVGNHGIWPVEDVPVADMSDERWHETVAVNLHAIFYACRAAARRIRDDGRIVLVGSTAGQRGEAYHADYAASKGALISFVKGFCVELAPRGITVNCVAPGWIDTEMSAPCFEGDGRRRIEAGIPLGRVASAEDVAGPIVFLCSSLARHITGEIMNVNGGAVLVG